MMLVHFEYFFEPNIFFLYHRSKWPKSGDSVGSAGGHEEFVLNGMWSCRGMAWRAFLATSPPPGQCEVAQRTLCTVHIAPVCFTACTVTVTVYLAVQSHTIH